MRSRVGLSVHLSLQLSGFLPGLALVLDTGELDLVEDELRDGVGEGGGHGQEGGLGLESVLVSHELDLGQRTVLLGVAATHQRLSQLCKVVWKSHVMGHTRYHYQVLHILT